jgi:hypothetical protein
MTAQVPALFETLYGMSMTDLLSKVRMIGNKSVGDNPAKPGALTPSPGAGQ